MPANAPTIAVLPGDGIGAEVIAATLPVLDRLAPRHRAPLRAPARRGVLLSRHRNGDERGDVPSRRCGGCDPARRNGLAGNTCRGRNGARAPARASRPARPLRRRPPRARDPGRAGGARRPPRAGDRPRDRPREHRGAVPFARLRQGHRHGRRDAADHPREHRASGTLLLPARRALRAGARPTRRGQAR